MIPFLTILSRLLALCLLALALGVCPTHAAQSSSARRRNEAKVNLSHPYAINLLSSRDPIDPGTLPRLEVFARYRLYLTRFVKDGKVWERLRLGFFATRQEAQKVANSLQGAFKGAWVTRVTRRERERSKNSAIVFVIPRELHHNAGTGSNATVKEEVASPPAPAPEKPVKSVAIATSTPATKVEAPQATPARGPSLATPSGPVEPSPQSAPEQVAAVQPGATEEISEERLQALMDEAEKAMKQGEYRKAVQFYTKVLQYPDHKFRPLAQELLGLARERNGQMAQARAEYEKYLQLYPRGEAADRVRQRLAGIVTARARPKEKLPEAKRTASPVRSTMYGSFAQYYNRSENFTDPGGNVVTQSLLSSNLDLTANRRSDDYNLNYVLSIGYDGDFLDSKNSDVSLSQHFVDFLHRPTGISAKIGRQTRGTDGVLGRFDGGVVSYQVRDRVKVNVLSGLAQQSSALDKFDAHRFFYGSSVDIGTLANHWDLNFYTIRQDNDGLLDRFAIGGEARYFDPKRSLFSTIDYDVYYNALNTALVIGNWTFPDKTTVNITGDYRKSPILTTANALIGQTVNSLSALQDSFSDSEIRDLARDRTADTWSMSLGVTRPLDEQIQINAEFRMSDVKGTQASGGVDAVPGTGIEYFYNTQIIGTSLIKQGDIAILGLGYSNTSNSDIFSLNVNTRYPFTREWRINPRLVVSYRNGSGNNSDQIKFTPALATDYFWHRRIRFELNGGIEWAPDWVGGQNGSSFDYFFTLGYRVDF